MESQRSFQPLLNYTSDLVARRQYLDGNVVIPHFDPGESGADAQVLILLEAPGPMTNADITRPGSGFISVDNDDQTAADSWNLRNETGLHGGVLHWNIVPWYLGPASKKPNAAELKDGALETLCLLKTLPELRVVLACGLYAQNGWRRHVAPLLPNDNITVINTWHPSPLALKQPGKRNELKEAFTRAGALLR